jgi:PAS domain-containing protein
LTAKENQLRIALDNLPGALVYTDADMNLVVCNSRYREIYDLPEKYVRPGSYLPDLFRFWPSVGNTARATSTPWLPNE